MKTETPASSGPRSGDFCSFGREPVPAHYITHYRCDDYADGTVTDCTTGAVITRVTGAPRGFERLAPASDPEQHTERHSADVRAGGVSTMLNIETPARIEVIERRHDFIAVDVATGERIGSFDKLAGAQRGTIRGRIVARTFPAWLEAIEALEHPDDCAYCQAGEPSIHAYEPVTL